MPTPPSHGALRMPVLFAIVCAGVVTICDGSDIRRHDSLRKRSDRQSLTPDGLPPQNASRVPPSRTQPDDKEAARQLVRESKKDAHRTYRKAAGMNPYLMMKADIILVMDFMMPGKRPDYHKKGLELTCGWLAVLWFVVYKRFFYKSDRDEGLARWADVNIKVRRDAAGTMDMKPDLILVFHKPTYDYADKDQPLSRSALKTVLLPQLHKDKKHKKVSSRTDILFQNSLDLLKNCTRSVKLKHFVSAFSSSHDSKPTQKTQEPEAPDTDRSELEQREAAGDDQHVTTLGQAREALLRDIYQQLPEAGLEVNVFSSVDDDELHVCVTLSDENTIKYLLQAQGIRLQLQQSVVEELGIDQPPKEAESSPPYVRYGSSLAGEILGEGKTDKDLFALHGSDYSHAKSILSGAKRIKLIHAELTRLFNLDLAEQNKLLVTWFPTHAPHRVAQLQSSWARWSLLKDFSFVQPATLLSSYFGHRTAFMFAWNGMYCKLLLALLPVALVFEVINISFTVAGRTEFWNRGSVMGLSCVVAIWGKFAANMWRREEEYLNHLWDVENVEDKLIRVDFDGTLMTSTIDKKMQEMYYSEWKYRLRMSISWLITLAFCAVSLVVVLCWINAFDGNPTFSAPIGQAVIVQIFSQVFEVMVERLTIAENHKYQDDFYVSYLRKTFIFQFVNQYSYWFYIAMKQQFTAHGCMFHGDCVGMLKAQLPLSMMCLVMMRIALVLAATAQVKFSLWWEARQIVANGGTWPEYSFAEEQSKYRKFTISDQVNSMTTLVLTLGYVLIFGAAVPRIIPLCFLVFTVQLRGLAVQLTTATCRNVPRAASGIGAWQDIVQFLLVVGVLFSGYLLVQFGPSLRETGLLTRLFCLCLFVAGTMLACCLVDLVLPDHSLKTDILRGRRLHVVKKMLQKGEDDKFMQTSAVEKQEEGQTGTRKDLRMPSLRDYAADETPYLEEIETGAWEEIPKAIREQ